MRNGMGLGWLVQRDRCFVIKEVFRSLSHLMGLQHLLLCCLIFLGKVNMDCHAPEKKVWALEFQTQVELQVKYPLGDKVNPIAEVTWRHKNKSVRILKHANDKTECSGGYCNRITYYFKNNTLLLNNVSKDDEGSYEVLMLFNNSSIFCPILHLGVIKMSFSAVPPRIEVNLNNSHKRLVLKCEVERNPNLSYHWLKSGHLLPQDERHSLMEKNLTLQVNNLTSADCVSYTCVALNGRHRSEGHVHLNKSVVDACAPRSGPILHWKSILSIVVAATCALGVCGVTLCIRKRHEIQRCLRACIRHERPASRREENPVYENFRGEQMLPADQEVMQLTCVYTDFIPSRQRLAEIEDFGYSTLMAVQPKSSVAPGQC
ncbi:hypothetical protein GJAV_G00138630 [Gymnothorax javanicus]|nr:hypothetical protein GJAV_G00138630 [Gymnothorax javanicus]